MRRTGFRTFLSMLSISALTLTSPVQAEIIKPVSVKGIGKYTNTLHLLIDGRTPLQGAAFDDPSCVYWYDPSVSFVIDLGALYMISGITMQVDNNDNYRLSCSRDGRRYTSVLYLGSETGETGWGMETVSTGKGHKEYIQELRFTPGPARYIKLSASGGDLIYAASEILVSGTRAVNLMPQLNSGNTKPAAVD